MEVLDVDYTLYNIHGQISPFKIIAYNSTEQ